MDNIEFFRADISTLQWYYSTDTEILLFSDKILLNNNIFLYQMWKYN